MVANEIVQDFDIVKLRRTLGKWGGGVGWKLIQRMVWCDEACFHP